MKATVKSSDLELTVDVDRFTTAGTNIFDRSYIGMISFVATESVAKSVIAVLHLGKRGGWIEMEDESFTVYPEGYEIRRMKLPRYRAVHVVAVAKVKGLLFGELEPALAAYLKSPEISTPILDEWIPNVIESLKDFGLIAPVKSFGISAHYCTVTSEQLDEVVTKLLQNKTITIPSKRHLHAG
ncbi:hypothetical protein VN12_26765 [Pirellula sp. SH-Sr6A]|uniref:hypothetical protein n=1 Tax=Pirellula sp. SH-Sr6A TaxID=1632865 RepID=UPI00078D3E92|nr:hypothetical protein [Pirellula sp. SH-Sr6A]AMV35724.1 hypothetical protein VN12_26765 [Pirellula sp. SH-Sr6A]